MEVHMTRRSIARKRPAPLIIPRTDADQERLFLARRLVQGAIVSPYPARRDTQAGYTHQGKT
jgi:hypothetical protein